MAELRTLEAAGEQGNTENKFIILSTDELANMLKAAGKEGAKKGIEAYEKRKETARIEKADNLRNSAKDIIVNYRRLKGMKTSSVCDPSTVTDSTLREILEGLAGKVREEDFTLNSTTRNKIKTGMLMNHVDVKLEEYKKECKRSRIEDIRRRYRVIDMMYLREARMTADEVAEEEHIDKSTVYRTLEKAYEDLTALIFGIDGVISLRIKKQAKKSRRKAKK